MRWPTLIHACINRPIIGLLLNDSNFFVSLKFGGGFAHLVVIGHIHWILALLIRMHATDSIKVSTLLDKFTLLEHVADRIFFL